MDAVNGKTHICKYLIKDLKVNVDVRDGEGTTPLHQAILGCHYTTAVYLLENGANINATCKEGFTPLHFAAKQGFKKLIKLLISRGAEIKAACRSGTPLQMAADGGKIDCVKTLLDNHADPNAIHYRMFSPLVEAICANSIECVKLLLQCFGLELSDATILSDAQACRSLRPNWPKEFCREGELWKLLKDYRRAASMFLAGWQLDNENKDLEYAFLETLFLLVKSTKLNSGNA